MILQSNVHFPDTDNAQNGKLNDIKTKMSHMYSNVFLFIISNYSDTYKQPVGKEESKIFTQ